MEVDQHTVNFGLLVVPQELLAVRQGSEQILSVPD